MVAAWVSGCLADISARMKDHQLQLNLAKTELIVFPATPSLQQTFTIRLGLSTITPIKFRQKSWSNLWWPADLQRPHCKAGIIMQVFAAQHHVISRLDYGNALLSFLSLIVSLHYGLRLSSSSKHWCLHTEQPQAPHSTVSPHYESTSPPEAWSVSEQRLKVPSQKGTTCLSRTFLNIMSTCVIYLFRMNRFLCSSFVSHFG